MNERILEHVRTAWAAWAILLVATQARAKYPFQFPGPVPGSAQAIIKPDEIILENEALSCAWSIAGGRLKPQRITDGLTSTTLELHETECFQLILHDGRIVKASDLPMASKPMLRHLEPSRTSRRLADQFPGRQIIVTLTSSDQNLSIEWSGILRDDSSYVRQEVVFEARNKPIAVKQIVLWELPAAGAQVMGTVDGSPVAAGNMFFAYENPLSKSRLLEKGFQCSMDRPVPLTPDQPLRQSATAGVVPKGQLRRGFLYYLERERAHPYRPFLHYNSWYDIGYRSEKIQPKQFLQVVELFGKELISRRGVTMDSFVLDDGWDNPASLWRFHEGFPDGFAALKRAVEKYNSVLGAWLSPFGGYGDAKQARLKYGQEQGFETNQSGFSLAGPRYYSRFRDACLGMIQDYGLNYFKFDGIGTTGRPTGSAPEFVSDMEALMQLIRDLRRAKPDVFINITSGMWTSPFWLWYGDSVWRSGRDWGTHGAGSQRRQQVTYRDNETYHNVVMRSPLHPLNSLMTQGVMFANHGLPEETDYLAEDIHAFFASGTNCQELYITPSLLNQQTWDTLAEAAKWSRDNSDVLADTHWVGGDPAEAEVYGWASWAQRKGILSLRNPSDKPGQITIDLGEVFELPRGAPQRYTLKSPWKQDLDDKGIVLSAGKEYTFELEPFDVLVFDARPL